jgi:hypothetical protein
MEIDYGNKRSQMIIAGILVITVLSILVGFALVVGDFGNLSQNTILPINGGIVNNPEMNISRNDADVSVGKGGCIDNVPTAAGKISLYDSNFPPLEWTELPLCITDADLASWYIDLNVTGGYAPHDGSITFTQCGEEQHIYISWQTFDYCCYTIYRATFTTDDGCIEFLSSQEPIVDLPFGQYVCDVDLGSKAVDIDWCTCWTGCHFCMILAHKSIFPESPTSD